MSGVPFAAVLLAGGRSRRMGRDKALLPLSDGRRLWERQLDVLRTLGPAELFISGRAREGFPGDVPLLEDDLPGLGPLAGIVAALAAARSPRLIVLAVDLPAMTTGLLRGLLTPTPTGDSTGGTIPQYADGSYEPLAAVYPCAALEIGRAQLTEADRSLQTFAKRLRRAGLAAAYAVPAPEVGLFANWNRPEDLPPDAFTSPAASA